MGDRPALRETEKYRHDLNRSHDLDRSHAINEQKKKDRPVLFALEIACFRHGIDSCLTVLVRIELFMCGLEFVLFCSLVFTLSFAALSF